MRFCCNEIRLVRAGHLHDERWKAAVCVHHPAMGGFVRPLSFVTEQAQVRRSFEAYTHPLLSMRVGTTGQCRELICGSKVKHVLYGEGNIAYMMSMNGEYVPPDSAIPPGSMLSSRGGMFPPPHAAGCPRLCVLLADVIPQPPGCECLSR